MSPKIVMYGPEETLLDQLRDNTGDETEIEWVDSNLSIEEASSAMKDTMAIILRGTSNFATELAAKCPNLRLIQTTSAGTNALDKSSLGELGIKVANNGGGNATAVAEHAIALMVGIYRNLHLQFQNVQDRNWQGDIRRFSHSHELTGKTVGIIGLGRIGSGVARRLQGWDCDLIYDDIVGPDPDLVSKLGLKKVDKDELLETSDLITLHVPLTKLTRGMISDSEFDLMKPTAVLINTSRGPVVDEEAFIRAMNEDKIMAAGIDVLEVEPTPDNNPLIDMDNVLITPHLAGNSQEAVQKSLAFAMYNCSLVFRGEDPQSVVLPDD